jgi:hypothetical protein
MHDLARMYLTQRLHYLDGKPKEITERPNPVIEVKRNTAKILHHNGMEIFHDLEGQRSNDAINAPSHCGRALERGRYLEFTFEARKGFRGGV